MSKSSDEDGLDRTVDREDDVIIFVPAFVLITLTGLLLLIIFLENISADEFDDIDDGIESDGDNEPFPFNDETPDEDEHDEEYGC